MKTLVEHLVDDKNKFKHIAADELCMRFQDFALHRFNYEKETRIALYRFAVLTLNYLNSQCNREDFSIESFFKILHCEITEPDFKEKETTADILFGDGAKEDATVHLMHEYYKSYAKHMPDDAYDFFLHGWDSIARFYGLEYDKEAIEQLWKSHGEEAKKRTEERKVEIHFSPVAEDNPIRNLLVAFADYRADGENSSYISLMQILETLPKDAENDEVIYEEFCDLIEDWRKYQPVFQVIEENFNR